MIVTKRSVKIFIEKMLKEVLVFIINYLGQMKECGLVPQYATVTLLFFLTPFFLLPKLYFLVFFSYNLIFYSIVRVKFSAKERMLRGEQEFWWSLDGWSFEKEVAKVLRKNGYKRVKVTKGSGDNGVDIIFYRGTRKFIAQCKHYKTPVTPEPVRALWGVKEDFKADVAVMIASSGVTKMSKEFIDSKSNYWLWTMSDIIRMSRV